MGSVASTYDRSESARYIGRNSKVSETPRVSEKRGFELSGAQLLVLWSLMAGLLIMSFLFGFYAGRDQGLRVAFEQYSGQAARIPVADPIASENSLRELLTDQSAAGVSTFGVSTFGAGTSQGVAGVDDEATFDFSQEGKLATTPQQVQAAVELENPAPPAPLGVVAPSAATPAVRSMSNLTAGWYIQVAATKTQEEADEITAKIKKAGYDSAIEIAEVNSQKYFRVLIGTYQSRSEAESSRQVLAKKKLTQAVPFLKRISE